MIQDTSENIMPENDPAVTESWGQRIYTYFTQVQSSLNDLAAQEAETCGAADISRRPGGLFFSGTLETGYRFCLWSRIASRLLMLLNSSPDTHDRESLYALAREISWEDHISPDTSIMVNASSDGKSWAPHTHGAALVVKDAVADRMRDLFDRRPEVDTDRPDITIHLHLDRHGTSIYLDVSGESLHRRGYRAAAAKTMLKEHLAAALLLRSHWDISAGEGLPFLDPFCGSGTLPIEAALIAGDVAPGLYNTDRFGFFSWKQHNAALWDRLLMEAKERMAEGLKRMPPITAWDIDPKIIDICRKNVQSAGLEHFITCERRDALKITRSDAEALMRQAQVLPEKNSTENSGGSDSRSGMIVSDLPYGKRSGNAAWSEHGKRSGEQVRQVQDKNDELPALYAAFGRVLTQAFPGWKVSLLTQKPELLRSLKLKPSRVNKLHNGPLECLLGRFEIFDTEKRSDLTRKSAEDEKRAQEKTLSPRAEMAVNRLKKNQKQLKKYLSRDGISCWRLYDADMPEFSAAIDMYRTEQHGLWTHVQEYAPPKTIDPEDARERLQELIDAVQRSFDIPYDHISVKERSRQRGSRQYTKLASTGQRLVVQESGLQFLINLKDYLDSGIFLDHRPVRTMIRQMARGRDMLNLFCYTGTATVYAAAGGASSTTSIDLSHTYLSWAQENMKLNGFGGSSHRFIQSDVFTWLREEKEHLNRKDEKTRYGLIFLDPPTFSNSKRFSGSFDTQRDHVTLIHLTMKRLEFGGTLIFSTNFRKFQLDQSLAEEYAVTDISSSTIPQDYSRNRSIHQCWMIRHRRNV